MKLKLLTLRYGEWTVIASVFIDWLLRFFKIGINPVFPLLIPLFAYLQHTWAGTRIYLIPALFANIFMQICQTASLLAEGWPKSLRLGISFLFTAISAWLCYNVPVRLFPCFRDHHNYLGARDLKLKRKLEDGRRPNVLMYYPAEFASEQEHDEALNSDRNLLFSRYGEKGIRVQFELNKTPYFLGAWMTKQHLDVISGARVHRVAPGEKYTPIVFSHGMFGGLTDYSNLCKAAALSFGNCIVFNLEHSDGSATIHQREDGSLMIHKTLAEAKKEGWKEFDFRNTQLNHRVQEVKLFLDELLSLKGEILDGVTVKDLDLTRLTIMGHSFGGATALKSCLDDSRLKYCLCMDPWMFPISEGDRKKSLSQPTIFIQNHYFHQTIPEYDNFGMLMDLLDGQDLSKIRHYVLTGTGHIFHSDWGILSGADYSYFFGSHLAEVANCEESMKVNNRLLQQYLRHVVGGSHRFDALDAFANSLPKDRIDDVSQLSLQELDEYRKKKFVSVKKGEK